MKVIVINGPMGVGKTTVGKIIADRYPGTAFIDGDWCMDLHPFVGNAETKAMAVDNILHMVGNYMRCSACSMVVLVWLMDDPQVCRQIMEGLSAMQADVEYVTLVCDEESLIRRWKNDRNCEWRTDEWLEASLRLLPRFAADCAGEMSIWQDSMYAGSRLPARWNGNGITKSAGIRMNGRTGQSGRKRRLPISGKERRSLTMESWTETLSAKQRPSSIWIQHRTAKA